jgi:rhomboid protease GluP
MGCEKYKPTYIIIAINVAFFIYGAILSGNALVTGNDFVWQWGQVNGRILFEGAYYQLFTAMFVHASIVHLTGNMLFLLIFGLRGEEMFSLPEYLAIYLVGGLVGNILTLVAFDPLFVSVGASGAIFSMFGACIIYGRQGVRQSLLGAIVYAFFLFFISTGEGVNILAHLGGLLFGLLLGYLLGVTRKPSHQEKERYSYSATMPF